MTRQFLHAFLDGTRVIPARRNPGFDHETIIWGVLALIHGGLFVVLFDVLIRSLI